VFAGAHEDILVCRPGSAASEVVGTVGPWVGATADIRDAIVEQELSLEVGDVVLLFTDGAIEARNAHGHQFGLERLRREFERRRHESIEVIHEELMRVIRGWTALRDDDVTLLAFRHDGE
jgi:serine phosphatase RsbU (regulator of sigma subunit)